MVPNYATLGRLLADAFKRSESDLEFDSSILDAVIREYSPRLQAAWDEARQPGPGRFPVNLGEFLDECVAASNDTRLGRVWGESNGAATIATYYYAAVDGEPSAKLLRGIGSCVKVSCGTTPKPLSALISSDGLGPILKELVARYGSEGVVANILIGVRPDLSGLLLMDGDDNDDSNHAQPGDDIGRSVINEDDPIPGYPYRARVQMGTAESIEELARLAIEVDCEPFDRHAERLRHLCGYDGSGVDTWRAIFAHDWRNGAVPLDDGRAWWRSTNLCDKLGCQVFALLGSTEEDGRWVLERFCSASEMLSLLGIREARPPRPGYHRLDWMLRLLHKAQKSQRRLLESGVVEVVSRRLTEGRELGRDDLALLTYYMDAWGNIRSFATRCGLEGELGVQIVGASLDELVEAVTSTMSSEDLQSRWIECLRSVVLGCAECFEQAMIITHPPRFDSDLQAIDDASSHLEQMRDWLKDTSETYLSMVSFFREGTTYEACGDALTRIEEYLGLRTLSPLFTVLCDFFRAAEIPTSDLQSMLSGSHPADPDMSSADLDILEDAHTPSGESAETDALDARADSWEDGSSALRIAPMRDEERALKGPEGEAWTPPVLGSYLGSQDDEDLQSHPVLDASEATKGLRPNPRDLLLNGYEQYYDRALRTGRACDLVSSSAFGGVFEADRSDGQTILSEFLYGISKRSLEGFLDLVDASIADGIRPSGIQCMFAAFEEPDEEKTPVDLYARYYLLRSFAERLRVASGFGSSDDLEYYLSIFVDACERGAALDVHIACTVCESALKLCGTLSDSCIGLAANVFTIAGAEMSEAHAEILAFRKAVVGSYLSPELLERRIRKHQGKRELEALKAYAEGLGPDSYNDKFSGSTYLWKWLISQDCDERFERVRCMIAAMRDGIESPNVGWAFVDEDDIAEFIDGSYSMQNSAAGRPNERIEGSPKRKLIRFLGEVSLKFEQYCETVGAGGETYVNPLYESMYEEAAQRLLRVRSLLSELAGNLPEYPYGVMTRSLLESYPDDTVAWEVEAPFDPDDKPEDASATESAFYEMQAHRPDLLQMEWNSTNVLPTETKLAEETSKALRAYVYNVIDSDTREHVRQVLAGVLGIRDRNKSGGCANQHEIRGAYWAFECQAMQLDHSMERACTRLRKNIERQIDDDAKPNDSGKQNLRNMLERIESDGSPEVVLSYGDFLVEADVAVPMVPKAGPDDVLYGAKGLNAVYDSVRDDLIAQGGFFPSSRIPGIPLDIRSTDLQMARDCITRIERLVDMSPVPVNGSARMLTDNREKEAAKQFCDLSKRLMGIIGFASVAVSPLIEDGAIWRFAMDFASIPGALLPSGSPVCPLAQLVRMQPVPLARRGTNARLNLEVYTSFESLMESIPRRDTKTAGRRIALYLGHASSDSDDRRMLTLRDRARVAQEASSSGEGSGFLLLDHVLLAFLMHYDVSGSRPGASERLGTFFRCASQFTNLHPYADRGLPSDERRKPSKGKTVPLDQPPLFYGRSVDIDRIKSFQNGSAEIVYGARRMGKTSILREVEAITSAKRAVRLGGTQTDDDAMTIAAYCDLRGITGGGVDNFWVSFLKPAFEQAAPGQIEGLELAGSAEEVKASMRSFTAKSGYRLLALLDEADDMVRYDSFITEERSEQTSILDSLYAFRETVPCFRFVLCGLHATMRYSGPVANRVTGHMGEPVVVAPLWEGGGYLDAYKLVYEPLKAMGVRLEHESVLNIIRLAGYYPNLINQICEKLLEKVRQRRDLWTLEGGPYVSVPNYLVESVFADYDEMLRRNFEETIALDRVYGTIVYSMAVIGVRHGWGSVGVSDILPILEEARKETGIDSCPSDLDVYLQELVTFRILRGEDRRYVIRDPELRSILESLGEHGTMNGLCHALRAWRDERNTSYHPELARDVVDWRPDGTYVLSPLNRMQISKVEDLFGETNVCIIRGSDEVGLDRLVQLTQSRPHLLAPSLRGWNSRPLIDMDGFLGLRATVGGEACLWIVTDGWDASSVSRARNVADDTNRFLFISGPMQSWKLISEESDLEDLTIELSPLEPDNLRQWLRRAMGDSADRVIDDVTAMTGGLSAMVLDLDVDALRGDLPVVQGDVRITTDIHRVLEDSPVLTSVVRTICEQGSVESQTVGEWYEWCQLGSDCPESEDDFKGVIEWLRSMHLLESMGPLSDGRITWATTIRPMTWAVRVFAGG